jgi:dolichol kinase
MVLVNKKMLAGGMAMLIVGLILTISINASVPVGQAGMTEEEVIDLMLAEQENEDYNTLAGILFGLGFLLVLISFGARRKKGSKLKKNIEKKAE